VRVAQSSQVPSSLAVIGFDMGCTSRDVSRYPGSLQHVFETETAKVAHQRPQLDISTVAAGWFPGKFAPKPQKLSLIPQSTPFSSRSFVFTLWALQSKWTHAAEQLCLNQHQKAYRLFMLTILTIRWSCRECIAYLMPPWHEMCRRVSE
jgi:hypothetical protein